MKKCNLCSCIYFHIQTKFNNAGNVKQNKDLLQQQRKPELAPQNNVIKDTSE